MPPLAPVNVVKLSISGQQNGSVDWGIREFFKYSGSAPSSGDLTAINTEAGSAWTADVAPIQGNTVTATLFVSQDLGSSTGIVVPSAGTITGSRGTPAVEAALAMNFSYGIARHYRGGHPRTYLPCGIDTDLSNPASWTTGFQTLAQTAWTNFLNAVAGTTGLSCGTLTHVNVPFYHGVYTTTPPWRGPGFKYPPKPNPTPVPDTIISVVAKLKVSSQKRRRTALTP